MPCGPVTIGRVVETQSGITVLTNRPDFDNLGDTVSIVWHDRRLISADQRRKAHALVGEICEWAGYYGSSEHEEMNTDLKQRFMQSQADMIIKDMFSLANCDMTTARNYISYLIDFMIRHDIPSKVPLIQLCDDLERYIYACIVNRKCVICGKRAEIHHCEGSQVGMGRNRKKIIHVGLEIMPLCREHHDLCHTMGQARFNELYHVIGMIADETICRKLGLKCEVD